VHEINLITIAKDLLPVLVKFSVPPCGRSNYCERFESTFGAQRHEFLSYDFARRVAGYKYQALLVTWFKTCTCIVR